jgi:hypothetical protein
LKTKGANPQEVTGKYVVVWEKVGNDRQLAADIMSGTSLCYRVG